MFSSLRMRRDHLAREQSQYIEADFLNKQISLAKYKADEATEFSRISDHLLKKLC